jgi:hypothetical protein
VRDPETILPQAQIHRKQIVLGEQYRHIVIFSMQGLRYSQIGDSDVIRVLFVMGFDDCQDRIRIDRRRYPGTTAPSGMFSFRNKRLTYCLECRRPLVALLWCCCRSSGSGLSAGDVGIILRFATVRHCGYGFGLEVDC